MKRSRASRVVAAFGLALSWIFAFVALTVRGAEAAQSAGLRGDLPARLRELGLRAGREHARLAADVREGEPRHADRERRAHLRARGGVPGSLGGAAAWIIGLLAIFVPLCVWRYRRMS